MSASTASTLAHTILTSFVVVTSAGSLNMLMYQNGGYVVLTLYGLGFLRPSLPIFS